MRFALNIDIARLDGSAPVSQRLAEAFELASMAEESGFEMVFLAEHHTIEMAVGPNPFITLASWAAQLPRLHMGPAVLAVPYWHPIRLAEEAALFDLLSGGRLELGLGRGAYQYEMDRMSQGLGPERGRELLGEFIPLVRDLWAGKPVARVEDPWSFPEAVAVPRPESAGGPPIWVAARHPDSFDFAMRNGCNVMANALAEPFGEVEALVQRHREAVAKAEMLTTPPLMVMRGVAVYEDEGAWMQPVDYLYRYARHFRALFDGEKNVQAGFVAPLDLEHVTGHKNYEPEAIRTNHLFGTPAEVAAKVAQYEEVGVDHLLYATTPGTPHEFAKRSLQLFIDEVMPSFAEAG